MLKRDVVDGLKFVADGIKSVKTIAEAMKGGGDCVKAKHPEIQSDLRSVILEQGKSLFVIKEARSAFLQSRDARADLGPNIWLRALANNQRLAAEHLGIDFGALQAGSAADLIILDCFGPAPLTPENPRALPVRDELGGS